MSTNGTVEVNGTSIGTPLQQLLLADSIQPGSDPSYQICKLIYSYHPLGSKMVDGPIEKAQAYPREVTVPGAPDEVAKAFLDQWEEDGCEEHIANVGRLSRIYGIASATIVETGKDPKQPVDFKKLWKSTVTYNVLDPLNTAGSLVLSQDPNSPDFQKHASISVGGKAYARNRSVTLMNEKPLYIEYVPSAFGFVGRSVYQRALFPLKSFVNTMVTDDMVAVKAGLLIAFIKGAGSFVDNMVARFAGIKRSLLKTAVVGNVLSMGPDDKVESLNFQNLDGPAGQARTNILKNVATAAKMPAVMLENETLTEGFGEGSEDAKVIAEFADGIRRWLKPAYDFFDVPTQHRAWNPDFCERIKRLYPDQYGAMDADAMFLEWREKFTAAWPSLLKEPESEQIKVEDVKFKALLATAEVLVPHLDPENKATVFEWIADNLNQHKLLFASPLELDMDLLRAWTPPEQQGAEGGDDKSSAGVNYRLDSAPRGHAGIKYYEDAVARLPLKLIGRGK